MSCPCQAFSGGGTVWWSVAGAGWNVPAGSGAAPQDSGLCLLLSLLVAVEGGVLCLGSMLSAGGLAQAESLLCRGSSGKC